MLISWQSYEGLKRTCYSVIHVTRFLLESGVECVLTERFCQDTLEQYFDNHRQHCRRSENPYMLMSMQMDYAFKKLFPAILEIMQVAKTTNDPGKEFQMNL